MRTFVWVTTQFEACHRWLGAPKDVYYLSYYHRHLFKVKVTIEVSHGNREVEFFQFKRKLDIYLKELYAGRKFEFSCEQIATDILKQFINCDSVEVSEDGENGATVEVERE